MKITKKVLLALFILIITSFTFSFIILDISNKNIEERKNIAQTSSNLKFAHVSIDDTINLFEDLKKNNYDSIFENNFLSKLRKLHNKYGTKFSLFVFYEFDNKCIEGTPTKYKDQFIENSDWLKFGFHAYSNESRYDSDYSKIKFEYNKTIDALKSIVGEESITDVLRLERFLLSNNNLNSINEDNYNIKGLLGADSFDRPDYYLDKEENKLLFTDDYYFDMDNNIFFYNTDIRIENIPYILINSELDKFKFDNNIILFTHEWNFNYQKLNKICLWLNRNYYRFDYPRIMED